jgi:mono/diheme cytochrome c family protein
MKTGFSRNKAVLGMASALVAVALAAITWSFLHPVVSRWMRGRVDFSRDIRPIFNQNCVACHGGVRQKNGVSFIFREEALGKGKSGRPTIVPGAPDSSELISRVTSKDPEVRMPYHAAPLPPEQVALLRRWIAEGAHWSDYWAFHPRRRRTRPNFSGGSPWT